MFSIRNPKINLINNNFKFTEHLKSIKLANCSVKSNYTIIHTYIYTSIYLYT